MTMIDDLDRLNHLDRVERAKDPRHRAAGHLDDAVRPGRRPAARGRWDGGPVAGPALGAAAEVALHGAAGRDRVRAAQPQRGVPEVQARAGGRRQKGRSGGRHRQAGPRPAGPGLVCSRRGPRRASSRGVRRLRGALSRWAGRGPRMPEAVSRETAQRRSEPSLLDKAVLAHPGATACWRASTCRRRQPDRWRTWRREAGEQPDDPAGSSAEAPPFLAETSPPLVWALAAVGARRQRPGGPGGGDLMSPEVATLTSPPPSPVKRRMEPCDSPSVRSMARSDMPSWRRWRICRGKRGRRRRGPSRRGRSPGSSGEGGSLATGHKGVLVRTSGAQSLTKSLTDSRKLRGTGWHGVGPSRAFLSTNA